MALRAGNLLRHHAVATGVALALLGLFVLPGSAAAQNEAACQVSVMPFTTENGTIVVDANDTVTVSATADGVPRPVDVSYLGTRWRLVESAGGSGTLDVAAFAVWGVGLYEIAWGADCTRTVKVTGPFFEAVAAVAATIALAVGLVGLLLTFSWRVRITNPRARWVLKLTATGKLERDEETGKLHPKLSYTVTQTLLGTLWGLLTGGATLVMLQQAALAPPTIELALEATLPLTVLGLLAGLRRGRPRAVPVYGAPVPPAHV